MDGGVGVVMMYSNAQYIKNLHGTVHAISVEINGVISFVPIDSSNSDYVAIMALVEEKKLTIAEAN